MRGVFSGCLLFLCSATLWGQSVTADFAIGSTACINQDLKPTNLSTNATRYEWDFCQGDLGSTPDGVDVATLGGSVTTGVDLVYDGANWYGFVTSQGTNSVLRLDFGADIFSTPIVTSLGNIGGKTNSPTDIKIVNDSGNWYGFVYNLADPMISRINFGSSLTNTTTSPSPITANAVVLGNGAVNGGFDIMNDGSNWILVLTNNSAFTIVRMPVISGSPGGADVISGVVNSFGSQMGDVVLVRSSGNYYGYVVAFGNKTLQRLSFGASLFSTPTVNDITLPFLSNYSPYGIDIGYDDGHYSLFISTLEGSIIRVDLGVDLSTISANASLTGSFSIFENTLKIRLIKHKTSWLTFSPSWQTTKLFRLAFQNPTCNTILEGTSPIFSFDSQATRFVTIRSFNASGAFAEATRSIDVTSGIAPTADFTMTGMCSTSPTQFSATSPDNIASYDWKFGDVVTGNGQNVSHQYAAGAYDVELAATAAGGCANSVFKTITAYNKPVPDFTLPAGMICTNNNFLFANQTPDNFDGNLAYEWSVNTDVVGTTRDLQYALTTEGNNDIQLKVSIPGCSDQLTKTINSVSPGPVVGFTFTGKCETDSFDFTNMSSGDISGYSWTFGDGNSSTATNTSNIYNTKGSYTVTLNTSAPNGCVSTTSQLVNVYSVPAPAFSIDLPPFSCSGTPSQFHNATPSMTDSNIQTWNWMYGDTGSGTGKDPLHTYANAGQYSVRLSVTTDRGCSSFVDQQVNIAQSPIALFNFDPTCVNQPTHLADGSTGGVVSWQWKVASALYNTQNATHTFPAPGNYNVQLVVTGQNNCTASLTRQATVPVVPTVDFQVTNPCSGQATVFSDITNNFTDPVTQHAWTFNDTGNATGQQASYTFDDSGTYPVQLTVQGQSGCSYSITKQVTIRTSPVASFTMSDQSGPPPLHVVFTNTSTGASTYAWSLGDGSSPSTAVSLEHTFASLGDYNVSLVATSADGCSTSETKILKVITPVIELALENFLLKQSNGNSSYQGYVQVRNNGNYRITAFAVNYETGGGIVLAETVPADLSAGEVKTYTLSTSFNQPAGAAFVCAELNVDTNNTNNKACATLGDEPVIFTVSPNPADSYIDIESIHPGKDEVRIRLFGMQGRLAYDRLFGVESGLSRFSLDLQNLSTGIYVVVITTGEITSSSRLLIIR